MTKHNVTLSIEDGVLQAFQTKVGKGNVSAALEAYMRSYLDQKDREGLTVSKDEYKALEVRKVGQGSLQDEGRTEEGKGLRSAHGLYSEDRLELTRLEQPARLLRETAR
jgi:hypothetical protein